MVLLTAALWVWLGSGAASRLRGITRPTRRPDSQVPRGEVTSRKSRGGDEERMLVLAQAPVVADLLSAAVAAGSSVSQATETLTRVLDEPMRSRLEHVHVATQLGASPSDAWGSLLDDDALSPIASAVIRSAHTGASVSVVLDAAAGDLRQAHRAQVEVAARSAGVRSVAPLALCFLPAYLLVGVVPVIAGFAESMFR